MNQYTSKDKKLTKMGGIPKTVPVCLQNFQDNPDAMPGGEAFRQTDMFMEVIKGTLHPL